MKSIIGVHRCHRWLKNKLPLACLFVLMAVSTAPAVEQKQPNIILILADDQGWNSLSVQMDPDRVDSKSDYFQTPHLARLAKGGMRFSQAYSPAPVCSPTRHSIQFGISPAKMHATSNHMYHVRHNNPPMALANMIKKANPNYAAAHFGKWHVWHDPKACGYDYSDGRTGNPEGNNSTNEQDPKRVYEVTKRSADFIKKTVSQNKPFFLQVSHYANHYNFKASPEMMDKYKALPKGTRHQDIAYAAMNSDLDAGVGQLMDLIDELGIADNTYIIYTADNGYDQSGDKELEENGIAKRKAWPLSYSKGYVYEGGIRVPFIARGPGIKANTFSKVPVILFDLMPTILEIIDPSAQLPPEAEGGSFLSVLNSEGKGNVARPNDFFCFHFPDDVWPAQTSIIQGNHKLTKSWAFDRVELFDLRNDISERKDLSKQHPERADKLHTLMTNYLNSVEAEYAPEEYLEIDRTGIYLQKKYPPKKKLVHLLKKKPSQHEKPNAIPSSNDNSGLDWEAINKREPKILSYKERFRPQFHFSAPNSWMNDPHGMLYHEPTKTWHLYYQVTPGDTIPHWKDPNKLKAAWGHATSKDLLHWEHQPLSDVWGGSGTGFIDYGNSLGFGDNKEDVYLLFTGGKTEISTDLGMRYTKRLVSPYAGADPMVFWYAPQNKWKKINFHRGKNGSKKGSYFEMLESDDLRTWTKLGKMKGDGFFECPGLFQMTVEGTDVVKWILHDASGKYQVGNFDGKDFTGEGKMYQFSYDHVFYASYRFWRSWDPNERQVQMAWLRTGNVDGMPFSQQLTIPCDLQLIKKNGALMISRLPVREIETIRDRVLFKNDQVKPAAGENLFKVKGDLFDLSGIIDFSEADDDAELVLSIRGKEIKYGKAFFKDKLGTDRASLRVLVDRCSIEIFLNDGTYNQTMKFFPEQDNMQFSMSASAKGMSVQNLELYSLKSVWPPEGVKELVPVMTREEAKEHQMNLKREMIK